MTRYIPFIKDNEVWVREWVGDEPDSLDFDGFEDYCSAYNLWHEASNAPTYPSHPDHVEWFRERVGSVVEVDLVEEPDRVVSWVNLKEGDSVICSFGNSGHKFWEQLRKPNKIKHIIKYDNKPNELVFEWLEHTTFSANDFTLYTTYAIPKEEKDLWVEAEMMLKDKFNGLTDKWRPRAYEMPEWVLQQLKKQHYTLTKK